jgi:hypothetical protein
MRVDVTAANAGISVAMGDANEELAAELEALSFTYGAELQQHKPMTLGLLIHGAQPALEQPGDCNSLMQARRCMAANPAPPAVVAADLQRDPRLSVHS